MADTLVFIPAWNEESSLPEVLADAHRELPEVDVLVIDDGSTDATAAVAKAGGALVVSFPENRGLRQGIAEGYRRAADGGYDYCGRLDADGQHPAAELARMLVLVRAGECDVAVGSRFLPESGDYQPTPERIFGTSLLRLLMRLRLGQSISDGTSGLYAVNHKALELLADPYVCEAPEVEALVRITDAKLRLLEVPVHMRQREHGESSFRGRRAAELVVTIGLTLFAGELLRRRHQRKHRKSVLPFLKFIDSALPVRRSSTSLDRVASVRLHRSELCVPGANVRMIEKAPRLGADVVMLDLEDAVAPDDKAQARENVITALRELDWSGCSVSLRINGLDTHYCYRDIVDVIEQGGAWLDTVLVPKASCAGDIHLVATLLTQIEDAVGLGRRIGISALIETAKGMTGVEEIAAACPDRMEALIFGVADYAASMQSHTTSIGGSDAGYAMLTDPAGDGARDLHWGDQWHYALARIAVACRANGLRPVDGPFGDFNDPEGYLAAARRAAVLGFEGKWAIHPNQVELAHDVFSPDERLITRTRRIVEAMKEAARDGKGAVSLDGRLIDAASLRMAEHLLQKIALIEERTVGSSEAWPARSSSAS